MAHPILATTVVGSYPQPDWLVDRQMLSKGVPRVRQRGMWRIPEPLLEQAQDDATVVAIRDMERAGIDIITDGEIRRESYSNRFATALDGVDVDNPGVIRNRPGQEIVVPRVVGRIRRTHAGRGAGHGVSPPSTRIAWPRSPCPVPSRWPSRRRTSSIAIPEEMAMDFAAAVNAEARDLQAAGADVIQLDEPWLRNDPGGGQALRRSRDQSGAWRGSPSPRALHLCFGYAAVIRQQKPTGYSFLPQLAETIAEQISIEAAQPRLDLGVLADLSGKTIILGVIDLGDPGVETAEQVAARIRAALARVTPERLILAPDCGMKYLPRDTAFGKLAPSAPPRALVRSRVALGCCNGVVRLMGETGPPTEGRCVRPRYEAGSLSPSAGAATSKALTTPDRRAK